jgi:hypothetical protein
MAPKRSRKGRKTRKNRKKSRKIKGGQSPSYGFKGDQRSNANGSYDVFKSPEYGFVKSQQSIASGPYGQFASPEYGFTRQGSRYKNASPNSLSIKSAPKSAPKSAEKIYDFTNFKDVKGKIKKIGKLSANGFVNQIEYRIGQYRSYAILKSSRNERADNLMYEYNVGQYINSVNNQYPCFLKTYGLFKYKTEGDFSKEDTWDAMQNNQGELLASDVLPYLKKIDTIDYTIACKEPIYLAILIEYFKDVHTLNAMLSLDFSKKHLMEILFQIYIPLAQLKNTFTHYDLHLGNVLIYTPVKNNEYIEYHYYMNDQFNPVSFKSKYMAKIIDYGRCYFYADKDNNSNKIYEEVCNTPACKPECGIDKGFYRLQIAQTNNENNDLRLIKYLGIYPRLLTPDLKTMTENVLYNDKQTPKINNIPDDLKTIKNVSDAMKTIMRHVTSETYKDQNARIYEYDKKFGDLHVYMDGREMEFVKTA